MGGGAGRSFPVRLPCEIAVCECEFRLSYAYGGGWAYDVGVCESSRIRMCAARLLRVGVCARACACSMLTCACLCIYLRTRERLSV